MKARHSTKRKRGRPPLPANEREPSGRRSRKKSVTYIHNMETNMNIAVETRIRHHRLVDTKDRDGKITTAAQHAISPLWGTTLGRMLALGHIPTKAQFEAGEKYAEDMARYYGLVGIPFPSTRAAHLFAVKSDEEAADKGVRRVLTAEDRDEAVAAARKRAKALRDLLLDVGDINTGRKVERAVKTVALLDLDCGDDAALRMGLNALVKFYRG